jgi:hypothetical protein
MARLPFGKDTRIKLIRKHLEERDELTPITAWQFIYEELLWIDISTGLAHLYESDKAQPGRHWYNRTVKFTNLLCEKFGNITRAELKGKIDRLFRAIIAEIPHSEGTEISEDNAKRALTETQVPDKVINEIVEAATSRNGSSENATDEDLAVEFTQIILEQTSLDRNQAEQLAITLVRRARFYYKVGNKRQNVLGEGFEDLLQILMIKVAKVPEGRIVMRTRANKLPGFKSKSNRKREEAPDIAVIGTSETQILASVKWSIRHDRQKQFSDELNSYAELLDQPVRPKYIIITNEYDPGRLLFLCNVEPHQGFEVDRVYHINPEILLGVLSDHDRFSDLKHQIETGKIGSIKEFLEDISQI